MMMNHIGLLDEDAARREILKLMRLLRIRRELQREPETRIEEIILPLQRKAVRDEIRKTMDYLRRWHVNLKVLFKDENNRPEE